MAVTLLPVQGCNYVLLVLGAGKKEQARKGKSTLHICGCGCLCGSKFSMNSRTLTRNTTIFICDISIQLLLFVCFTTFLLSFRLTNCTLNFEGHSITSTSIHHCLKRVGLC